MSITEQSTATSGPVAKGNGHNVPTPAPANSPGTAAATVEARKAPSAPRHVARPRSATPMPSPRSPTSSIVRCTRRSRASPPGCRRRRWLMPIWIGRRISPMRPASGCNSSTRRCAKLCASPITPCARACRAARPNAASSRCRRTSASPAKTGSAGPTISSTRRFLLNQQWWHNATTGVRGLSKQHENMVEFASRQILDMVSPSNFLLTNPEVAAAHAQQGRHESGQRLAEPRGGLGARGQRQEAGRHREVRGRPRRRGHARQGGLSQPADRAHPVRAGDRQGAAGADSHRAGLDHEILHPRSVAAELAGEIPHRAGLHGVHDLLEESRAGRSRSRHGRLSRRSA